VHCVYLITGASGVYVGISRNPEHRWSGHKYDSKTVNTRLYRAMRKHGVESFHFSVIEQYEFREDAIAAEIWWIAYLRSLRAKVYNITAGGDSPTHTPESREKVRAALLGKKHSPERVEANRRGQTGLKRKPHSAETKLKIAKAHLGKKLSAAQRERLRKANLGKKLSAEHRAAISAGLYKHYSGKECPSS
jgi:group I intron endonuclease